MRQAQKNADEVTKTNDRAETKNTTEDELFWRSFNGLVDNFFQLC